MVTRRAFVPHLIGQYPLRHLIVEPHGTGERPLGQVCTVGHNTDGANRRVQPILDVVNPVQPVDPEVLRCGNEQPLPDGREVGGRERLAQEPGRPGQRNDPDALVQGAERDLTLYRPTVLVLEVGIPLGIPEQNIPRLVPVLGGARDLPQQGEPKRRLGQVVVHGPEPRRVIRITGEPRTVNRTAMPMGANRVVFELDGMIRTEEFMVVAGRAFGQVQGPLERPGHVGVQPLHRSGKGRLLRPHADTVELLRTKHHA